MRRREIYKAMKASAKIQWRKTLLMEGIFNNTIVPAGAVLHFWDNNEDNDHFSNLIVCPSQVYSNMLHARVIEKFGSYHEFTKSRARFRKDLKRERQAKRRATV